MTTGAQPPTQLGTLVHDWWQSLQPKLEPGGRKTGDPGALARLRRADLTGAALEEITLDLFRRLAPLSRLSRDTLFERTALIAAVLAHVREDDGRKVAVVAGEKTHRGQHVLHPLRLRRLFAAKTSVDCLAAFRRLVALLRNKANVSDLSESLMDWPDEWRGESRRRRWAFDYYGAGAAAYGESEQTTV